MSDVWTPPRAEVKDIGLSGNPNAPEIRRAHLNHEASVKAVGSLYFLGAIFAFLAAVVFLAIPFTRGSSDFPMLAGVAMAAIMAALGALYLWIARGLRSLSAVARIPAGVLAGLGLMGFPIGTLINGYILYLLFSRKGTMVFSDEYKDIIADTPDIKYRTSVIVWIFLGLVVLLFVAGILAAIFGGR